MTSVVGRNYARALFELAVEAGRLDAVEEDLHAARAALQDDRGVSDFLGNRLIGRPTKKAAIAAGLAGQADALVVRLLDVLVERGRTRLLGEIDEELARLARLARGVRRVTVRSAEPLDTAGRAGVTRALEARYGGHVELAEEAGAPVIGGLATESEGEEIAFTLAGQLKDLRDRLAESGES